MIFNASGGASLNFKVVGGTSQPTSARENTIWVNTSTTITSWAFAATEPETSSEGMVWLVSGNSSKTVFNALKKNGIQVALLGTQQYIDGRWKNMDAKIYQDGAWNDLAGCTIYRDGIEFVTTADYTLNGSTVNFGSGSIVTATNAGKISEAYAVFGPILLDDVDTLRMIAAFTDRYGGTHNHVLYVSQSPSAGYKKAAAIATKNAGTSKETFVVELSVSALSGEYYVYAGQHTSGSAWESQREQQITEVSMG